jgi:hypothetical protein
MLVARAVGLAPAAQALAQVARSRRRQGVIVVLVVGHQRVPLRARGIANATKTAARARPAAEAAGGEEQGNYLPGLVPVVDGAFAPLVPLVLLPGAVELLEEPGVLELLEEPGVLELLELLLGELPDVLEVPAPDVVSVEAEPETEAEPEVPGVALLLGDEVELLLLVSDGGVVVLGVVLLVDDELLGVEPVLPLPLLLQPVAATEARAIAATRGIRCFMTSSPIRFTCVEEMLSRMIRALGALRPACAASTREQR